MLVVKALYMPFSSGTDRVSKAAQRSILSAELLIKELLASYREDMTASEFRQLRRALGLSQKRLAEILGVTRATVNRAERLGPSRFLEAYLDRALRAGEIGVPSEGKKPRKKSNSEKIFLSVISYR